MMKKILLLVLIVLVLIGLYAAYNVFGPTVSTPPTGKYFYVRTGSTYADVKKDLSDQRIIGSEFFFNQIAKYAGYDTQVKAGRYEITKSNLVDLVRMLKRGSQSPVRLVITKLRTKEDLAGKIGKNFEIDSLQVIQFLTSNDSLKKYGLDSNNVMTIIIPNSYLLWWNSSLKSIIAKFAEQKELFWMGSRSQKAKALGLTPDEVYTMASIVEEETNKKEDKGRVASTYINRIGKGMKLEADPTVKYAMRNFGLKRIYRNHLLYESPYNTYRQVGLPPGPICTPSINTIDAVLNAPETNYLFFVAKPDLKGYSNFAATYSEHLVYAKAYQKALDSIFIARSQSKP